MKLRIFRDAIHPSGKAGFEAIIRGCRAVGDSIDYTDDIDAECDVAVHASDVKGGRLAQSGLSRARAALKKRFGKRRLVLESPCIRQGLKVGAYWRLSTGGFLRDEATYPVPDDYNGARWERIAEEQGIEIQPWSQTGETALVILQKPSDASLRGCNAHNWGLATISSIREHVPWTIVVRPHPLDREGHPDYVAGREGIRVSTDLTPKGLKADLIRARAVITYTSLTAIESICAGVPTWTMDKGNLAYEVANHYFSRLESPHLTPEDEIEDWLHKLSYYQWTVKEIETGLPWTILKQKLSAHV